MKYLAALQLLFKILDWTNEFLNRVKQAVREQWLKQSRELAHRYENAKTDAERLENAKTESKHYSDMP